MKKRERVFAAMKHEPVDRIPCYFTTHFAREAAFGQAAVEEHLKFFREVNPDIQKIMNENLVPNMGSIKTPEDWKCIRTITLKDKFMEDEIELVKRVLDRCDRDAFNIGTLHGIVASTIHPIEPDYGYMPVRQLLCSHLRQNKGPVLDAMKRIADGLCQLAGKFVELGLDGILWVLRVPEELKLLMKDYLVIIFLGITATFLYNYFANLLRAIGNSVVPLVFLAVSALLNVALDLLCVIVFGWGVKGAAGATVFSQFVSGIGIGIYTLKKFPELCPKREDCRWDKQNLASILNLSVMTSVQQSIMNFGILMVQGLVNSFGTVIMAAFAAAVKIDSFAYMPVQDFGNAFSTYVAQNYGAGQSERIRKGIRSAGLTSALFCIFISVMVCLFASPLMGIFIDVSQVDIIAAGVHYLRIEGACYIGIGILFLLYGYYRAVNQPGMSVVLTIASLGTRVALAYLLSATPLGVTGIWLSVPIGWALADAIGIGYYLVRYKKVTQ